MQVNDHIIRKFLLGLHKERKDSMSYFGLYFGTWTRPVYFSTFIRAGRAMKRLFIHKDCIIATHASLSYF